MNVNEIVSMVLNRAVTIDKDTGFMTVNCKREMEDIINNKFRVYNYPFMAQIEDTNLLVDHKLKVNLIDI